MARTNRARQSPTATGFGSLMARGVRTLLSVLPGSKLTTGIADFAFKALGYSQEIVVLDANSGMVKVTFLATGLTALFHLALKDILFDSVSHGTRINAAEWVTNYEGGRLLSLNIAVIPQARLEQRQGQWAAVFIPFRSDEERKFYDEKKQGMLYEQVKVIPGAKSAPATKPLRLSFTPGSRDGRLNYDIGLKDEIGLVSIGFDQTNRAEYGEFALDSFSCTVIVSGVVQLQRPHEVPYASKFGRTLDDKLKLVEAIVLTPDRSLQFQVATPPDGLEVDLPTSSSAISVAGIVQHEVCEKILSRTLQDMTIG